MKENSTKKVENVKSKISTKYQVVIPKEVRRVLNDATPGTNVYITAIDPKNIKIEIKSERWATRAKGIVSQKFYD